jgi:outer membrane protein X
MVQPGMFFEHAFFVLKPKKTSDFCFFINETLLPSDVVIYSNFENNKLQFMKGLIAGIFGVLSFVGASAQSESERIFKPFKVDVSLGFALPMGGGTGAKGGVLFAIEPKYAVVEQIAVGIRMEGAGMARAVIDNGTEVVGEAQLNGSYLLTGDYYFSNNTFRPFLGAGAGLYSIAGAAVNSNDPLQEEDVFTERNFGVMLRGGFEAGHFRLGIEYNIAGKTSFSTNNDYLGFKLGVCIGGGRYKN